MELEGLISVVKSDEVRTSLGEDSWLPETTDDWDTPIELSVADVVLIVLTNVCEPDKLSLDGTKRLEESLKDRELSGVDDEFVPSSAVDKITLVATMTGVADDGSRISLLWLVEMIAWEDSRMLEDLS